MSALKRRILLRNTCGLRPAVTPSGSPDRGSDVRPTMAALAGALPANRIFGQLGQAGAWVSQLCCFSAAASSTINTIGIDHRQGAQNVALHIPVGRAG